MSSVERRKRIDMPRYIRDKSRLTLEEAAAVVEGQAVQLAPSGTGTLRGSMYRKRISEHEYEVGSTVDYAVYVEFGTGKFAERGGRSTPWTYYNEKLQQFVTTSGHRAQPFLRPALDFLRSRLARVWRSQGGGR